jgi:hypothetical protein
MEILLKNNKNNCIKNSWAKTWRVDYALDIITRSTNQFSILASIDNTQHSA